MEELAGRLALDPDAQENIRVVAHFDLLMRRRASSEALVRAATMLTGCAAGFRSEDAGLRIDADGLRGPAPEITPSPWPHAEFGDLGLTWIERDGALHASDRMIVERLALALTFALEGGHRPALDTLLDPWTEPAERTAAIIRLRLDPRAHYRILASEPQIEPSSRSIVLPTLAGRTRASLISATSEIPSASRIGVGTPVEPLALRESWSGALIALRVLGPRETLLHADELGAALLLLEQADTLLRPHPDVEAIGRLARGDDRALDLIDAYVSADSVRAAAEFAGLHHSTMQRWVTTTSAALGFDIGSRRGRPRLVLALQLFRLIDRSSSDAGRRSQVDRPVDVR